MQTPDFSFRETSSGWAQRRETAFGCLRLPHVQSEKLLFLRNKRRIDYSDVAGYPIWKISDHQLAPQTCLQESKILSYLQAREDASSSRIPRSPKSLSRRLTSEGRSPEANPLYAKVHALDVSLRIYFIFSSLCSVFEGFEPGQLAARKSRQGKLSKLSMSLHLLPSRSLSRTL